MKNKISVLAVGLLVFFVLLTPAHAAAFSDVAANVSYADAVAYVSQRGIIEGYSDGEFKPNNTVTRGQISAMICRLVGESENLLVNGNLFSDMPTSVWCNGYVTKAVSLNIINGFQDGTFRPNHVVSYNQAIAMLLRAFGLRGEAESAGGYPNGYVSVANRYHLLDGVGFKSESGIKRYEIAVIIYNARNLDGLSDNIAVLDYEKNGSGIIQFEDRQILDLLVRSGANLNKDIFESTNRRIYQDLHSESSWNVASYEWKTYRNLFSIVIRRDANDGLAEWTDFYVYNVSLKTGELLSNSEVLNTVGWTEQVYRNTTKQALASECWRPYTSNEEVFGDVAFVNLFNENLRKTISDQNISDAKPFLNSNNELCVVAKVYVDAGTGEYWSTFNLVDFDLIPNCFEEATVTKKSDISHEYLYQQIVTHYTSLWKPTGYYSCSDYDFKETSGQYELVLRYSMSEEEAEARLESGGMVLANTYVTTIWVDKFTGKVTDEAGTDTWFISL